MALLSRVPTILKPASAPPQQAVNAIMANAPTKIRSIPAGGDAPSAAEQQQPASPFDQYASDALAAAAEALQPLGPVTLGEPGAAAGGEGASAAPFPMPAPVPKPYPLDPNLVY